MGDNRKIKIHVYAKRQTWICTAWQSFSLNCLLLLLKNFIPVLYLRIVLDSFYLLVFCSEKISTWISLLPFAVNANLNLSNWNFAARKWKQARKPSGCSFFLSFSFFLFDDIIGRLKLSFVGQFLTYNNCEISLVVFMPIIATNHAITDPYLCSQIIYKRK